VAVDELEASLGIDDCSRRLVASSVRSHGVPATVSASKYSEHFAGEQCVSLSIEGGDIALGVLSGRVMRRSSAAPLSPAMESDFTGDRQKALQCFGSPRL